MANDLQCDTVDVQLLKANVFYDEEEKLMKLSPRARIFKVILGNPKQENSLSYERWKLYRDGMTVQDYENAVVAHTKYSAAKARSDIRWDLERNFIRLE